MLTTSSPTFVNLTLSGASIINGVGYYTGNLSSNAIITGTTSINSNGTMWAATSIDCDGIITGATINTPTLKINSATVTATAAELNLIDGSIAGTIVNSKAVIYSAAGQVRATSINANAGGYQSNSVAGGIMVFRANGAAAAKATWTTDGLWYDWDMSAIVPAGATGVILSGYTYDDTTGYITFRRNGETTTRMEATYTSINTYQWFNFIVPCDANRIIEYQAANKVWVDIQCYIVGWII
jgi:hypothetical protein